MDAAVPTPDSSVSDASTPDGQKPDAADPNDGFTDAEWATFRTLSPKAPKPPVDPTNKYADTPAAAVLGQMFFYDPAFSGPIVVGTNGTNGGLGTWGRSARSPA